MNYHLYFSPTGGTRAVVRHLGSRFGEGTALEAENICIVGVPSFGGRAPEFAVRILTERLKEVCSAKKQNEFF